VRTETHAPGQRRDGTRPARSVRRTRGRVQAARAEARGAAAAPRVGWRVEATQHRAAAWCLQPAVAASRRA